METVNSKKTKLSFMDCYRFVKELHLYLFTDNLLIEPIFSDSLLLEKINQKLEAIESNIMASGLKININQDWDIRIRDIKFGCEFAIRIETKAPFDPDKIEYQKKLEGEGKTIMDLNRPEIRFLWEAFKIGEKFSDEKNLKIHFLYNEFDGLFYKFTLQIRDIMKSIEKINLVKPVFIPFIYDTIECIVKNNIYGYNELSIEKYYKMKDINNDFIYDETQIEDIDCLFQKSGLIELVDLSQKLHMQMRKKANS